MRSFTQFFDRLQCFVILKIIPLNRRRFEITFVRSFRGCNQFLPFFIRLPVIAEFGLQFAAARSIFG